MALRLVTGRAGSGKTTHCIHAVADELAANPDGPPLILLVHQQATYQTERALLEAVRDRAGRGGYARALVFNFQRLAWRVLRETGGLAHPVLGDLGKRMLLRSILARRERELRLFGRTASRAGCVERLAHTLSELRAHCCSPEALDARRAALARQGRGESILALKLHDLSLLLRDFDAALAGRFLDTDDAVSRLAEALPRCRSMWGARAWIDGFTELTPQELGVVRALLAAGIETEVTLCVDALDLNPPDAAELDTPFLPTLETGRDLVELARRYGVPVSMTTMDQENRQAGKPAPRFRAEALVHVERSFLLSGSPPVSACADGVRLAGFPDRRAEVEAAAREVQRLVQDEGYRQREIVVATRDLEAYAPLVESAFGRRGISVSVDRQQRVAHHPLVELLRSTGEVVLSDWAYEPVFRLLKTGLLPSDRYDVDRLENYVLEFGIRGARWYDVTKWDFRAQSLEREQPASTIELERLEEIHRIREVVCKPMVAFHREVVAARSRPMPVAELAQALHRLLTTLGVDQRVEAWALAADLAGDGRAAKEHRLVWRGVVDLLEQLVQGLGSESLTLSRFQQVLEAGLEGLRAPVLPPGLDQVLVGSVERTRHADARAVLLLGAGDRAFPKAADEDLVFSDVEREELADAGLRLAPTSRNRVLHEQFLAYTTVTRARDWLYVSYAAADEEGRALGASPLVRRLQALCPGATAASDQSVAPNEPGDVCAHLIRQLRAARDRNGSIPGKLLDTYEALISDPAVRSTLLPALPALTYRCGAAPLPADLARTLYGVPLATSVSRLESYASCAFRHFAQYGLKLRERPVHGLEAPHLGQLQHAVLGEVARAVREQGLEWAELEARQVRGLIADVMGLVVPRLQNGALLDSERMRQLYHKLKNLLHEAVMLVVEHAQRGAFRPVEIEASFGPGAARLPALEFDLPGEALLVIRGRIDRIDVARLPDGREALRVVDYKSKQQDLKLERVYHGLSLQLGVYFLAALRGWNARSQGAEVHPAGLLYFPVHDPIIAVDRPQEESKARVLRRKQTRTNGWVSDDAAVVEGMDREVSGELVPVTRNKDGGFSARSRLLQQRHVQALFAHLEETVVRLGAEILDGNIAVSPYRIGAETACANCDFGGLCGFEEGGPGSEYRTLEKLKSPEVWTRLLPVAVDDVSPLPQEALTP